MESAISVRIQREDLTEIEEVSRIERRRKSEVLREILARGIRDMKLGIALEKFQRNEATVSKAAEIAGIPLTSFLDHLQKRNINFHYTLEDLKEDSLDLL